MDSVAVYLGSSVGQDPAFAEAATAMGTEVARRGLRLVYGGGNVGLMGLVADAALAAGGEVHGFITQALLEREVAHTGLTDLQVVETMHERKAAMLEAADAVVMLPGGFGTLEELFEALTWTQLAVHDIPCGVLDVADYFAGLRRFFDDSVAARFVSESNRHLVQFANEPAALLDWCAAWQPAVVDKWLDR